MPKLSIEYIIHFAIIYMNHPLAICQFDFNLKIVIKSKYGTLSKELGYKTY